MRASKTARLHNVQRVLLLSLYTVTAEIENNITEMVNMVNIMKRTHFGSILHFAETHTISLHWKTIFCKNTNQKSLGLQTGSDCLEVKDKKKNHQTIECSLSIPPEADVAFVAGKCD